MQDYRNIPHYGLEQAKPETPLWMKLVVGAVVLVVVIKLAEPDFTDTPFFTP